MANNADRLHPNRRNEVEEEEEDLSRFRTAESSITPLPLSNQATPLALRGDPFESLPQRTQTSQTNLQPPRQPRRIRSSSIRIQRLPSSTRTSQRLSGGVPGIQVDGPQAATETSAYDHAHSSDHQDDGAVQGRKRSFSAPERREDVLAALDAGTGPSNHPPSGFMPMIQEGRATSGGRPITPTSGAPNADPSSPQSTQTAPNRSSSRQSRPPLFGRLRSGYRSAIFSNDEDTGNRRESRATSNAEIEDEEDYHDEVANILDVVDPEVSTLTTLTNVQNSLFVPDLGRLLNRRPTYKLSAIPSADYDTDTTEGMTEAAELATVQKMAQQEEGGRSDDIALARRTTTRLTRSDTITSQISESRYAVLPHGISLQGWTQEDKAALNDHVRHMLHSRRSKIKRGLKGFWKYIQRPLGFLVTLYAFLITVFGLVWVLFLIGWISGGSDSRHKYLINVIDNVLVALFAVVGDGLAPFRAVDTYHMIFVAHYARLTWKLRKKSHLPKLENRNDLPVKTSVDIERASTESAKEQEISVLSPLQQKRLAHHQKKLARSHTFYKPHETSTHFAFSIRLLITIIVLLDCHSLLQISLGAVTWGWNWHTRPAVVTTVILICSITCNITAGIVISIGDKRSRKVEVVEQMFRQTLTEEAMKKVERHKKEKAEKATLEKEREADSDRLAYPGT